MFKSEESVLAKIQIGHTHLIHFLLLRKPSQCTACDWCLTVKHILFDFVDFTASRNIHFKVNSVKELFENVLPEIGLFYRL